MFVSDLFVGLLAYLHPLKSLKKQTWLSFVKTLKISMRVSSGVQALKRLIRSLLFSVMKWACQKFDFLITVASV